MSDAILPCHGDWYGEGCLWSVNKTEQTRPHHHADGTLHARCTRDDRCRITGHTDADHQPVPPRIGSPLD